MRIYERNVDIQTSFEGKLVIRHIREQIDANIDENEIPIRFVITQSANNSYKCELGVLRVNGDSMLPAIESSIFNFAHRKVENTNQFNAVLLIPTGIGAELGGHSGDAGPLARLLASSCDRLITHPNVLNASDINEIPENGLYIEGSALTSLMMGTVGFQEVRSNRIMLVIDKRFDRKIPELSINTVSAARSAIGIDCPIVVELDEPFTIISEYSSSGSAVGRIEALEKLSSILSKHENEYDAIALHTGVDVPEEFHMKYLKSKGEMLNPWGGVEAMLTHAITMMFGVPTAHAPMVPNMEIANLHAGIVDPRIAPEAISSTFLLSVLKGLHRSPRIVTDPDVMSHHSTLTAADVSCLIIPDGVLGLPTLAALEQGISVIAVRENRNIMKNDLTALPWAPGQLHTVENYWEAAGVLAAMKAGVVPDSVRRPLADTSVVGKENPMLEESIDKITVVHQDEPTLSAQENGRSS